MKSRIAPTIIVFGMLIFFRIVSEKSENLTIFVSIINLVALLTVWVSIAEQIRINITNKIKSYSLPKEVVTREVKHITLKLSMLSYIPFSLFIVMYFCFLSSALGNDILSIISLGFSFISSNIAELIVRKIKI